MRKGAVLFSTVLFLLLQNPAVVLGRVSNEVRREARRLEREATNVWEGLNEEAKFGGRIDQGTRLDVFNFVNGVRALREKVESRRAKARDLAATLKLVRLQSQVVDRSLRGAGLSRFIIRDWDEARASLRSLAGLLVPGQEPPATFRGRAGRKDNINDLQIRVREVRPVGNIFKSEYRVRGVISGRNIVSAGIYSGDRLLKPISVRLYERRFTENAFAVRLKAPEGEAKIRVIDSRGFVLEEPIEFPVRGLIPGF